MNEINELQSLWKNARKSVAYSPANTGELIRMAKAKKKETIKMHLLNILVLTITLMGIVAFFVYVAKFNELISHIGTGLMVGGLLIRIIIECFSIYRSSRVDMSESTIEANERFLRFHQFRKFIHGPVTITILVLYTIGFYMLTPEFSLYFSLPMMILIDLSYIIGAIIFTWSIRKAIRKELAQLDSLQKIRNEITQDK